MKHKLNIGFFAALVLLISVYSCKKTTETFELSGPEYASEKVDQIRIYKVDSQVFNINTAFGENRDYFFYERHWTKNKGIDSAGKEYFYHQVFKSFDLIDWLPYYTYRTYVDSINYTKVINNEKVIHLWWPVNEFKSWDGHLYNSKTGQQRFRYIEEDEFLNADSNYSGQVSVRLKKEILPITESFVHLETYAPNHGLVHSVKYFNNIQRIDTSALISESGYYLYHNLMEIR